MSFVLAELAQNQKNYRSISTKATAISKKSDGIK
jgi:hypothetical protein